MLTKEQKKEKRNWFVFIIGYFAAGYLIINWINQSRSYYFDVSLSFEKNIPFIPLFIFGYILVYLSVVLLYVIIDDIEELRRAVVVYLLVTTIHYILFLVFPVKCDLRPVLPAAGGVSMAVTRFYYFIDHPYNLFPSLHAAYSTLAALVSWRNHRHMRVVFAVMAVIVFVSVVLVKQHYILDVAAGALLSVILYGLVLVTERWWLKLWGV